MLGSDGQDREETVRRAQQRLARLDKERRKLVQMAYADAIPLDLLKSEQDRIRQEHEQAQQQLTQTEHSAEQIQQSYEQAVDLMQRGAQSTPSPDRRYDGSSTAPSSPASRSTPTKSASPWLNRGVKSPPPCTRPMKPH
jgi:chromosome segregation ATPase